MAPSISTFIPVVAWATCILFFEKYHAVKSVAASESSALQLERNALLETGWWSSNQTGKYSSHCRWDGIACNARGSVIAIDRNSASLGGKLKLNFSSFPNLVRVDLAGNNLQGSIPFEIGDCYALKELSLSRNSLKGSIPHRIIDLYWLGRINLSHNFLSGEIPVELGRASYLSILDFRFNKLTGIIPPHFSFIKEVNLSYNSLKGQIPVDYGLYYDQYHTPDTLIGNDDLCGDSMGFPPCPRNNLVGRKVEIVVSIAIFLGFLFLYCFLLSQCVVKKTLSESTEAKNGGLFSIWNYDGHIGYEDIIRATEDFDIKHCIGTGGYGSVYKADYPMAKWLP